jgi:hypothetical protein
MPASIAHHVSGCPAFVPGIRLCGHSRFSFDLAGGTAGISILQN